MTIKTIEGTERGTIIRAKLAVGCKGKRRSGMTCPTARAVRQAFGYMVSEVCVTSSGIYIRLNHRYRTQTYRLRNGYLFTATHKARLSLRLREGIRRFDKTGKHFDGNYVVEFTESNPNPQWRKWLDAHPSSANQSPRSRPKKARPRVGLAVNDGAKVPVRRNARGHTGTRTQPRLRVAKRGRA